MPIAHYLPQAALFLPHSPCFEEILPIWVTFSSSFPSWDWCHCLNWLHPQLLAWNEIKSTKALPPPKKVSFWPASWFYKSALYISSQLTIISSSSSTSEHPRLELSVYQENRLPRYGTLIIRRCQRSFAKVKFNSLLKEK